MATRSLTLILPLCLAAVACADTSDDVSGESQGAQTGAPGETAIETDGVSEVRLEQVRAHTAMPFPPPPGWTCFTESGVWTIDLANQKISAEACRSGRSVSVKRPLSDGELGRVRQALASVEKTMPITPCINSVDPYFTLDVKLPGGASEYIDRNTSCEGSRTAVTSESLTALAKVVEEIDLLQVSVELVPSHTALPYPPPAGWECFTESGKWTVDLAASRFFGEACRNVVEAGGVVRRIERVDRAISANDIKGVLEALEFVERAARLDECTDLNGEPYINVRVKGSKEEGVYVEQPASCVADRGSPVRGAGDLYNMMESLAAGH